MAARIPQNFLRASEQAIASYDWTDIAQGTGVTTFYAGDFSGANIADGSLLSEAYVLSNVTFESNVGASHGLLQAPWNHEFDVTFINPTRIGGDASVKIPFLFGTGTNETVSRTFGIELDRLDSAGGENFLCSGGVLKSKVMTINTYHFDEASIYLDIPETQIKGGEGLRLKLFVSPDGPNNGVNVAHDPAGRAYVDHKAYGSGGTDPTEWEIGTQLKLNLPIKLDL